MELLEFVEGWLFCCCHQQGEQREHECPEEKHGECREGQTADGAGNGELKSIGDVRSQNRDLEDLVVVIMTEVLLLVLSHCWPSMCPQATGPRQVHAKPPTGQAAIGHFWLFVLMLTCPMYTTHHPTYLTLNFYFRRCADTTSNTPLALVVTGFLRVIKTVTHNSYPTSYHFAQTLSYPSRQWGTPPQFWLMKTRHNTAVREPNRWRLPSRKLCETPTPSSGTRTRDVYDFALSC